METNARTAQAPLAYLIHLADNALVLGQRNAEWCGHGPVLEEDIALANMSLDLIGQARLLYQLASQRINADAAQAGAHAHLKGAREAGAVTEDTLAYFRETHEFRNLTLLELPHHGPLASTAATSRDWGTTIARNFLHSALAVLVWDALRASVDADLAAIADKSLKEARYHLRHSNDWLIRLGDGTDESHARMQAAIDHLMPYTQEFWAESPAEAKARANGTGLDMATLRPAWDRIVDEGLALATLERPAPQGHVSTGKRGVHSEHLGFLLAEMQGLARAHPEARW